MGEARKLEEVRSFNTMNLICLACVIVTLMSSLWCFLAHHVCEHSWFGSCVLRAACVSVMASVETLPNCRLVRRRWSCSFVLTDAPFKRNSEILPQV